MSRFKGLVARARSIFDARSSEARMEEEFRFHVEMEAQRLAGERGIEQTEARRRAMLSFGGLDTHREAMRDGRGARRRSRSRASPDSSACSRSSSRRWASTRSWQAASPSARARSASASPSVRRPPVSCGSSCAAARASASSDSAWDSRALPAWRDVTHVGLALRPVAGGSRHVRDRAARARRGRHRGDVDSGVACREARPGGGAAERLNRAGRFSPPAMR